MDKPNLVVVGNSNASTMRALSGYTGDAPVKIAVLKEPDLKGPHGKAWAVDEIALQKSCMIPMGIKPESITSCGLWIVEAPWAHPVWHSYVVTLIHLRLIEGEPPPRMYRPDATHEIVVFALDPDAPREALIAGRTPGGEYVLNPKQYASQFVEPSDESAVARVAHAVQEIVDGQLSPDTDHQDAWKARFGNCMFKKG